MKQRIMVFTVGVVTGALLCGGSVAYAAGLMAEPSNQKIYVDGTHVQMEAYSINGNNYVKLRDVGESVGFNVYWDGQSVQVDSDAPYTGAGPQSQPAGQIPGQADKLSYNADGSINVPTDGSKYVPKAGDRVRCDDGYIYEIKDVSRYDNNVFAEGPVGELPTATCDWSKYPTPKQPSVEVKHLTTSTGEDLFIRNLYETRRMQYTIYNALGKEPSAWQNGQLLATVELSIRVEDDAYTRFFWPWRSSELEKLVHSRPNSCYYVEAWDVYHNGIFQHTRYCVVSL